jgi:long-subunit acyl-CoA synthetase (AMP-forming)
VSAPKLILDHIYGHEMRSPGRLYLTQPMGGEQVAEYTWAQTMDQARRMAAHLKSLGYAPGARIGILSKNCAHFIIAEIAIWMAGHTTVAIFPTETADTVRFVLTHSEASLLFVGKLDSWPGQRPGVPAGLPLIALPLAPPDTGETWDAIIERTDPLKGQPSRAPDDIAMLIYTSGSTGQPKGAMVSFQAYTAASEGIKRDVRARVGEKTQSRQLSYLPLAHSMERAWGEGASLVDGGTHLFFAESLDTFVKDLRRARPTLFISVPRLWVKFQQGVFAKMPPKKLNLLLRIPILNKIVAKKVLTGLGLDEVIQAGSGSAPIPADLIAWYRRLGLRLFEGYGMTEDNSYSHSSNEKFSEVGYVGVPLPGVEVRIADDGEVLIKSPGQFSGYFKQPELNAESFTDDGFFHTGDRGERLPNGLLKITGRTKELFKTAKGKYVAPAPIETALNVHPMIELSLVSGVGRPGAYALVVLAEDLRGKLDRPEVRSEVELELEKHRQKVNDSHADHEHLLMLVVAKEPWTIENGLLTPTMKIRRTRIEAAVEPQVDGWFESKGTVKWA